MQRKEDHIDGKVPGEEMFTPPVDSLSENSLVAGQLRSMPNLFARGLIYLVVLAVMTFLLYSLIARVDIIAECRSVARPSTDIMRILADRSGYVEQVFVDEGETVRPGTPLFRIRSKETVGYASKADELREQLPLTERNFDLKISAARDRRDRLVEEHENSRKIFGLKLEQAGLNLSSLDTDLAYWRNETIILTDEVERFRRGRERGFASLPEYNNAVSRLERARTEEKKLVSQRQIAIREQEILHEEIRREQVVFEKDLAQQEKEIENLELEKTAAVQTIQSELSLNRKLLEIQKNTAAAAGPESRESGSLIRAETEGVISGMYFRNPGEYVSVSDLLCTLVPAGSPLFMDITVSNRDIGFIEEGMVVKYKFDAFPYADYGMLVGNVEMVAPSALESQGREFVYRVRGSLPQPSFTIRDRTYPVRAGMTAAAEVVTERISIFSLLFRKLKR